MYLNEFILSIHLAIKIYSKTKYTFRMCTEIAPDFVLTIFTLQHFTLIIYE